MTWTLLAQIVILMVAIQILIYTFVDQVMERRIERRKVEASLREADIYLAEVEATLWRAKNPDAKMVVWPTRHF